DAPWTGGQFVTLSADGRVLVAVAHNGYGTFVYDLDAHTRLWPRHFQGAVHRPAALVSHDGTLVVEAANPMLGHRVASTLDPLPGPTGPTGANRHCFAAASAAGMVAFGLGSWRDSGQRVVWVPLVEV